MENFLNESQKENLTEQEKINVLERHYTTGFLLEENTNIDPVYVKFISHKSMNRSQEIQYLSKIGVIKMPQVKFSVMNQDTTSIYKQCLSVEADLERLDRYFQDQKYVKKMTQEEIDYYSYEEYKTSLTSKK